MTTVPQPDEYSPFAANYIAEASNHDDVFELLHRLKDDSYAFFTSLPAEKADYAYAPGKWTVKQVLGHICDTERVFAFRAFCISRQEQQLIPGFDQNDYMAAADYNARTLQSLAEEFRSLRQSNLYFIDQLTEDQLSYRGNVSDYHPTVRALLYMMAGHELYHLKLLKERYL